MSVHMVVSPALEGRTVIVGMLTVDFDQLVENTSCATKMLVAKMVSKNEKDLRRNQIRALIKRSPYSPV